MSASSSSPQRVVPAHLSFLTIYNPALGPTDETLGDQILYYYSARFEEELEQRRADRQHRSKSDDQKTSQGQQVAREQEKKDDREAEQNERLRQVGLAQGMVDFVKNFSNGVPLESIETEKSRIVLKEVEPSWWILASINLTQLPQSSSSAQSTRKVANISQNKTDTKLSSSTGVEYSSREVAPPQLLLSQLIQAHRAFLLHHGSDLSELWKKHNGRLHFCSLLHRYWTQFSRSWDVLLHGNPAVELYDGVKLAGTGELGIGVGEEEWGSGEREVLEDFAGRTEGLIDLIVGRYGDSPSSHSDGKDNAAETSQQSDLSQAWLGQGQSSRAQDGIIFSGVGGISRRSLISISQWIEAIFVQGEAAYGVGENPASRTRARRKRRTPVPKRAHRHPPQNQDAIESDPNHEIRLKPTSTNNRAVNLRRTAIVNSANPPGIPPPLIGAVETSLQEATAKVSTRSESSMISDHKEESMKPSSSDPSQQGSLFGTEKMVKYLSLGYGSSWTLNPKGFASNTSHSDADGKVDDTGTGAEPESSLSQIEPVPAASDEDEEPFVQRLEQSIGKFLIGLSGDLESTEFHDDAEDPSGNNVEAEEKISRERSPPASTSPRIFLRTLTIEMSSSRHGQVSAATSGLRPASKAPATELDDQNLTGNGKTSAASSIDGSHPNISHERVQVAVYVHQPFIFVFLFQLHTPSLTMPAFYRRIHHTLGPLQKSLLRSTDVQTWRQRAEQTLHPEKLLTENKSGSTGDPLEIYDFIYDAEKMTIRTSVPNIPVPGSLAAEGLHRPQQLRPITVSGSWYTLGIPFGSNPASGTSSPTRSSGLVKSDWNRIEALSVHTHILNLWALTRNRSAGLSEAGVRSDEIERSVKTARGWWVVWMRVLPHVEDGGQINKDQGIKEAYLVRRAPQEQSAGRDSSGTRNETRNTSSGRWLLRDQPRSRETSGTGSTSGMGSNITTAKGVGQGVGVDARKWVEGLIALTR